MSHDDEILLHAILPDECGREMQSIECTERRREWLRGPREYRTLK